jgi:hypothetical protein
MHDSSLSGWQYLSEYWIPGEPAGDSQSLDQITFAVRALGMDARQVERIKEAIMLAIMHPKKLETQIREDSAVLIRLWVPELQIVEESLSMSEDNLDPRNESSGLGFFLIEKTVGNQDHPWKVYCRMVDILIYGK